MKLLPLLFALSGAAQAAVLVIGHANVPKLDPATVQKIFTGKAIEVAGVAVTPVNASPGNGARGRFLQTYLNQDEEKYTAYWTVRRYIGKGAPPKELASAADVIAYVQANPGSVGYIEEGDLKPGLSLNVLARK
ncbi:MAG: hypothetical protein H7Z39_16670 [Burkholderiaceae bacterium]|nr:hypothetical protein [Burkholderiaceae bacterium]